MARLHDTLIWNEDWFLELPLEYKLFYLYIYDHCDHSGIWRPNRSAFQVISGKLIMMDEFLAKVNKPTDADPQAERISKLENGRWLVTSFVAEQLGHLFRISIGAHRGALKLLVFNNVHPKRIPNMDWCGMEQYDLQELRNIAHGKGMYRLYIDQASPLHGDKEKEKEIYSNKKKVINNKDSKNLSGFFPKSDYLDLKLPTPKKGSVMELMKISKQTSLTDEQVEGFWKIFKEQNFTGDKHYKDNNAIFSHFINWMKTQNVSNGSTSFKRTDRATDLRAGQDLATAILSEQLDELQS